MRMSRNGSHYKKVKTSGQEKESEDQTTWNFEEDGNSSGPEKNTPEAETWLPNVAKNNYCVFIPDCSPSSVHPYLTLPLFNVNKSHTDNEDNTIGNYTLTAQVYRGTVNEKK